MLKKQVFSTKSGEIDRSVPPKRVYRNLDIERTIWKNLHNFNPEDRRLYVDQLFYRHAQRKVIEQILDRRGRSVRFDGPCDGSMRRFSLRFSRTLAARGRLTSSPSTPT